MAIKVEPLDAPMGAIVHGLDSRKPLSDDDFSTVEQAMLDHVAIVIPELEENVPWLRGFGHRFGPLVPHVLDQYHHPDGFEVSIIARNTGTAESRDTAKPAGAFWHSDLSYEKNPSDAIFLYSTHIPRAGGDTLAANMYLAYDNLPKKTKQRIEGLTATHRWGWNTGGATPKLTDEQSATHPDVIHPVVRRHPRTGRKILYVNPGYVMRINELAQAESAELLEELFAYALNPDIQYRHKWGLNMMLGLDNRASMHAAVDDYTEPRRMLRMIVGCTEKMHRAA
ncbi:MAG: TauD/TfdA family dioxygenase [Hyphomicrobiales bacterium]|nr:TauD/TfdA family dioxygenase [Hyphomicrobiales bacterium]